MIARIVKELPELLADYENCAVDYDGKLDATRRRRIQKFRDWLAALPAADAANIKCKR